MVYVWFVAAYLLAVHVGLRLLVPRLGFRKAPLPVTVPERFEAVIQAIHSEAQDDVDFVRRAYEYLAHTYHGSRIQTVTMFWRAFLDPLTIKSGFLPCNGQNHLLRIMCVRSGRFSDDDIDIRHVPLNLFVHQYVRVRAGGEWITVDPWAAVIGVPFGRKAAFIR